MMRPTSLAAVILLTAGSAFGTDLFTIHVPLEFQGIHPIISHVSVTCRLEGKLQPKASTLAGQTLIYPTKSVLMPLTQNTTSRQLDTQTSLPLGGFFKGIATVVFSELELVGNDPLLYDEALCYFALRGSDGQLHAPLGVSAGKPQFDSNTINSYPINVLQYGGFLPMPQYGHLWAPIFKPLNPSLTPEPPNTYLYRWQTFLVIR